VERVRVETARRLLESTDRSTEEIAAQSGFESADTLRRALGRSLGVGPRRYREAVREQGRNRGQS
jgi:transcriptional regulator GlxA family with amidase domain